jgi:hypothetical protein
MLFFQDSSCLSKMKNNKAAPQEARRNSQRTQSKNIMYSIEVNINNVHTKHCCQKAECNFCTPRIARVSSTVTAQANDDLSTMAT